MVEMPKIPRISRFCFCLDVMKGVLYASIFMAIIWAIYLIAAIVGSSSGGDRAWGAIWSLVNIVVYGLVIYCIAKDKSRNLLIPALVACVFDIVVGIINTVINFVFLNIFGAIILLLLVGLSVYFFLALNTVYEDKAGGGSATVEPAGGEIKQPV